MDAEIIKADGSSFRFSDHGVILDDFLVSSITMESSYGKIEGAQGRIDYGATHGERTIALPFHFDSYDLLDFPLLRDVLYGLVHDTESFYIRELRRPKLLQYGFVDFHETALNAEGKRAFKDETKNNYIGGKVYLVRLSDSFSPEQTLRRGKGQMTFETTELPYAESLGTTADIDNNGISANDELWGFGMGLTSEDVSYTHSAQTFSIYNASNVTVHPFQQDLTITIDNISGDSNGLELRNKTTGETFATTQAIGNGKTLKIDGPVVTLDGLQYLRNTNKQFISLAPGWNEFEVTATARVQFDFKFYYV